MFAFIVPIALFLVIQIDLRVSGTAFSTRTQKPVIAYVSELNFYQ